MNDSQNRKSYSFFKDRVGGQEEGSVWMMVDINNEAYQRRNYYESVGKIYKTMGVFGVADIFTFDQLCLQLDPILEKCYVSSLIEYVTNHRHN